MDVLVTLDRPILQPEISRRLHHLKDMIPTTLAHVYHLTPLRRLWQERISQLDVVFQKNAQPDPKRTRRGIFNFIGDISNKLFGTATEEQVSKLQLQIRALQHQDKRVTHAYNELLTVVNQTHGFAAKNREHIQQIEKYATQLTHMLKTISRQISGQANMINHLLERIEIGEFLASLEALHFQWIRQTDHFQEQRCALEAGWLTETILPPTELHHLLRAAHNAGYHSAPVSWYYEHVSISALWEDPDQLVFKAELPFIDSATFLRYQFYSWPVPSLTDDFKIQLQLPPDIAVHTDTGGLFQPRLCQGHKPQICRTGPIYDDSYFPCPQGVLSKDLTLQEQCLVTIKPHRSDANSTIIQELHPGTYVITSHGESYAILCSGEPAQITCITAGVYLLPLRPGCRAKGTGWTLMSLNSHHETLTLPVEPIQLKPLNLSLPIPTHITRASISNPSWVPLEPIPNIQLRHLSDPLKIETDNWNIWPTSETVWPSLMSCVSLGTSFVTLSLLWRANLFCPVARAAIRRRRGIKRRHSENLPGTEAKSPVGKIVTPTLPSTTTTTSVPPIWPILPQLETV